MKVNMETLALVFDLFSLFYLYSNFLTNTIVIINRHESGIQIVFFAATSRVIIHYIVDEKITTSAKAGGNKTFKIFLFKYFN